MNPRTVQRDDKSFVPVLYMAMELSNRNWKLLFGDGARRCQLSIAAGELLKFDGPRTTSSGHSENYS